MKREMLIDEIVDFCTNYRIIRKSPVELKQMKSNIDKNLYDAPFVERLYNEIFIKAKHRKVLNEKGVRALLMELENIRLDLE